MVLQKTTSPTAVAANVPPSDATGNPSATLHNHRHPTAYLSHLYYNSTASQNRQPWSLNYRPNNLSTNPSNESLLEFSSNSPNRGDRAAGAVANTGSNSSMFAFHAPCAAQESSATATSASGVAQSGATSPQFWLAASRQRRRQQQCQPQQTQQMFIGSDANGLLRLFENTNETNGTASDSRNNATVTGRRHRRNMEDLSNEEEEANSKVSRSLSSFTLSQS